MRQARALALTELYKAIHIQNYDNSLSIETLFSCAHVKPDGMTVSQLNIKEDGQCVMKKVYHLVILDGYP